MLYMNRDDIAFAVARGLHGATILRDFQREVDRVSDGWPYWTPAIRSAARLMALVQAPGEPTDAEVQKALRPMKAFLTRHGRAAGMRVEL